MSPLKTTSTADQASAPEKIDQADAVQIAGEKRKAESSSTEQDAGGKDLVESKQTTLDDVIQHEKKESESIPSRSEEKNEGPAAKKSKLDTDTEEKTKRNSESEERMEVDQEQEKEEEDGKEDYSKRATTPPSQLSQTEVLDRPHKSVKRVDNIADKPISSTPTKSATRGDNADASSSSPLRPSTSTSTDKPTTSGKSNGTNGANGTKNEETVPGDEEHLDHPENWTTGDEPATEKQKGYLKVLESQKGVSVGDTSTMGKSEASEKIDQLVANNDTNTSQPSKKGETTTTTTNATSGAADADSDATPKNAGAGADAETVPGDEAHLDHPENWTTGGEPATEKQKGFLKVLEKQKGVQVGDVSSIGKSEASEKIDELKNM